MQDFERTITTGGMFGKEEILFIYKALDLLGDLKDHKRFAFFLGLDGKYLFYKFLFSKTSYP